MKTTAEIERIMKIIEMYGEISMNEDLLDADFTELGMDSINFIQVVIKIEEEFQCEIPDSKLIMSEMNTVNKIYKILCNEDVL